MSDDLVFNEDSLRAAIVAIWGKHGAHVDVFDMMLKVIRSSGDELSAQAATIAELRAEVEGRDMLVSETISEWETSNHALETKIRELRAENERLAAWRAEGLAVLDEWDEVAAMCPSTLGTTKASQVKAHIARLTAENERLRQAVALAQEVAWDWRMDWSDFDGRTLVAQLADLDRVASGEYDAARFRQALGLPNQEIDESPEGAGE